MARFLHKIFLSGANPPPQDRSPIFPSRTGLLFLWNPQLPYEYLGVRVQAWKERF